MTVGRKARMYSNGKEPRKLKYSLSKSSVVLRSISLAFTI